MTEQKKKIETAQSVLVTGAAGLLGSYVTHAFKDAGYKVTGVDIAQRDGLDVTVADLTRLDAALELVRNVDHVVHIASLPRPVGYDVQDVYNTNMSLMFNIVEAMERN
ncbi:MAG: NAD-dependent epimerase/dehydratase family protein, partial [Brucella intermedia]